MNRWSLTISTTAAVLLFAIGAYSALESERYTLAALALIFAFYVPLQTEALRDKILHRKFVSANDGKTSNQSGEPPAADRSDH